MLKLIVGLGNPGLEYLNTRHNIGFQLIDKLVENYSILDISNKFYGKLIRIQIEKHDVFLLKPETYINHSGKSVIKLMQFYKIALQDIIVVHDDLDLDCGRIKIKTGGASGGHNGLKSIDENIGKEYMRLRIGISHPGNKDQVSRYVLANFTQEQECIINMTMSSIINNLSYLIVKEKDKFLNLCSNKK